MHHGVSPLPNSDKSLYQQSGWVNPYLFNIAGLSFLIMGWIIGTGIAFATGPFWNLCYTRLSIVSIPFALWSGLQHVPGDRMAWCAGQRVLHCRSDIGLNGLGDSSRRRVKRRGNNDGQWIEDKQQNQSRDSHAEWVNQAKFHRSLLKTILVNNWGHCSTQQHT